jgi:hypothetical protein
MCRQQKHAGMSVGSRAAPSVGMPPACLCLGSRVCLRSVLCCVLRGGVCRGASVLGQLLRCSGACGGCCGRRALSWPAASDATAASAGLPAPVQLAGTPPSCERAEQETCPAASKSQQESARKPSPVSCFSQDRKVKHANITGGSRAAHGQVAGGALTPIPSVPLGAVSRVLDIAGCAGMLRAGAVSAPPQGTM